MKGRKINSQCPQKIQKFQKKTSSKLSSGHVGCRFHNSAENIWTEDHNFIGECRKNHEHFFSLKCSIKIFRWTRKILSWPTRRNSFDKRPKLRCSLSWNDGNKFCSEKTRKLLSVKRLCQHIGCSFENSAETFLDRRPKLHRWLSGKKIKYFFFRKNFQQNVCIEKQTIFIKMFLWTRRI